MSKRSLQQALTRDLSKRPELSQRFRNLGLNSNSLAQLIESGTDESGRPKANLRSIIVAAGATSSDAAAAESIIVALGRPTLLVQNGSFELPSDVELAQRLNAARPLINSRLASVGRVEVDDGARRYPLGTAWLVAKNIVVTNRHVAQYFIEDGAGGAPQFMRNLQNRPHRANIDFLEEHGLVEENEIRVRRIVHFPPKRIDVPDIALLEIDPVDLAPIPLAGAPAKIDDWIAVVGYPLPDDRIPPEARAIEENYFGNIYGVKRLSPGMIDRKPNGETIPWIFAHDATTLGGNSGSAVLDLQTGAAVGLHFSGHYMVANYAVSADKVAEIMREAAVAPTVYALAPAPAEPVEEFDLGDAEAPQNLADRVGYRERFIARGAGFEVPMPEVTEKAPGEIATLKDGSSVLHYRNFSVVMNAERRLCYFSAVNIDGRKTFSIRGARPGWKIDNRLDADLQIIRECYGRETDGKFSRGHMTRREDPNWGETREEAVISNADTFFVTNACPQFQPFNAGIWLSLEDYALENADKDDMKISVFTGPIFEESDPDYFGVQVPVEFWKVIAFKHDETKELTATGYKMSQEDVLPREDEFIFGRFKSSQVTIRSIERRTGLSFGVLADVDALLGEGEESIIERPLRDVRDIVFRRAVG